MATNQTIASTLTMDTRPGVQSLRTWDTEVGKAFSRLDAMNKRAFASGGGGPTGALNGMASASSNASRGVLELSRGIEDFSTQFGTQGFAGGIRAASNNLSQMAMVMGGPVAGAIAGFAAAGATLAMPYIEGFFNATEQAKRFSEQLDIAIKKSRDLFEERSKEMEAAVDFRAERRGMDDGPSAITKRLAELDKIEARQKEIDAATERNRNNANIPIPRADQAGKLPDDANEVSVGKADQFDKELAREKLDLLRKERDLRAEIERLQTPPVIRNKQDELEKINERLKQLDEARQRNRFDRPEDGNFEARFGVENADAMREKAAKADQEDFRLANERLELLRKERDLRFEIGQLTADQLKLKQQEAELQRQKDAEEFGNIIRKFQEEDQQEAEREAERKEEQRGKQEQREFERLENLLQSKAEGLGGKVDPLDDFGLVGPGMDEARKLLGEIDALKDKKPGQLAGVATADSQSLLRAQAQAKDAAEAKRQRAELLKKLEDLIREVKNNRPPDIEDDVNLT
jgi:hypothetical protein